MVWSASTLLGLYPSIRYNACPPPSNQEGCGVCSLGLAYVVSDQVLHFGELVSQLYGRKVELSLVNVLGTSICTAHLLRTFSARGGVVSAPPNLFPLFPVRYAPVSNMQTNFIAERCICGWLVHQDLRALPAAKVCGSSSDRDITP